LEPTKRDSRAESEIEGAASKINTAVLVLYALKFVVFPWLKVIFFLQPKLFLILLFTFTTIES
jgi:hypothetical protein